MARNSVPATGDDRIIEAARLNNIKKVKELLAQGIKASYQNGYGFTALKATCANRQGASEALIKLLLNEGVDVNASDKLTKYTALHNTVFANQPRAAILLLKNGAEKSLFMKSTFNETPLEFAQRLGHVELIDILKDAMQKQQKIQNIKDSFNKPNFNATKKPLPVKTFKGFKR